MPRSRARYLRHHNRHHHRRSYRGFPVQSGIHRAVPRRTPRFLQVSGNADIAAIEGQRGGGGTPSRYFSIPSPMTPSRCASSYVLLGSLTSLGYGYDRRSRLLPRRYTSSSSVGRGSERLCRSSNVPSDCYRVFSFLFTFSLLVGDGESESGYHIS